MAWAYIPPGHETACPYVPAAVASTWVSCSQSQASTLAASSNGSHTPKNASSPPREPDTSRPRQSGPTCAHSMQRHGQGTSTPCWPDTPASPSALLDSAGARMTSDICGQKLPDAPASSAMASNGYSLKTSPGTSALALKPCCENFGTWVSRLRLAYSQRLKLARRMKGSGSSSWPTATRTDANGARSFALDGTRIRANAGPTLNDLASSWGAPRASDAEKGGPNQKFGAGGMPLPAQAAQWQTPVADDQMDRLRGKINSRGEPKLSAQALQWPTPAARDSKGANGPDHLQNGTGRLHMDQLPNAVAHGFTPPDLPTWHGGYMPSPHAPISRPLWAWMIASHGRPVSRRLWKGRSRRRLNPLFVEWLMGWPPGHALCACSATEFTRWQRDMRGALSQLPMASGPWIWEPSADEPPEPCQIELI